MSEFNGKPCVADMGGCGCLGHIMPGVMHIVACCDKPHIEDLDENPFITALMEAVRETPGVLGEAPVRDALDTTTGGDG